MKKAISIILMILFTLSLVSAGAEAVSGPANAFEYVRNFKHRLPIYSREYKVIINEQTGVYYPWTYADNDPDYSTISTPFGTLIVNTNDFSIVQCEFDISFSKDGVETYTSMDARGGIISICSLEYGTPYDDLYEASKKVLAESMFDTSRDMFDLITDPQNYDALSTDEEGIYTVYVTSAQYDYYLQYKRFTNYRGELTEYYSILAVAPGYVAY